MALRYLRLGPSGNATCANANSVGLCFRPWLERLEAKAQFGNRQRLTPEEEAAAPVGEKHEFAALKMAAGPARKRLHTEGGSADGEAFDPRRAGKRRLVVILEGASLESVKVRGGAPGWPEFLSLGEEYGGGSGRRSGFKLPFRSSRQRRKLLRGWVGGGFITFL